MFFKLKLFMLFIYSLENETNVFKNQFVFMLEDQQGKLYTLVKKIEGKKKPKEIFI